MKQIGFKQIGSKHIGAVKSGLSFYSPDVGESISAPTGFATGTITTTTIPTTWNVVENADHYETYKDGVLEDANVATNSFLFEALTENTAYVLGVLAVDALGNKSDLSTINASTIPTPIPDMFAYYPLQTDSVETINSPYSTIINSSYASKSLSGATQSTEMQSATFSTDGTKAYMLAIDTAIVYQYTLSTPFDTSTGSYANKSYDAAEAGNDARKVRFNSTGTSMYILSNANNAIYQYTLETAWDVSTASYANKSLDVSSQSTTPVGMCFNSNLSKVYVLEATNDTIYQYDLETAEDISTGSYATKSFATSTQEATPYGIYITNDNKLFVTGISGDYIWQYTITSGDISTASYDSVRVSVTSQDASPFDVFVKEDLSMMYIIGASDTIYQYDNVSRNGADTSISYSLGAVCNATNDKIALAQGFHIPPTSWSYSFWFNVSNVATEQRIGFNDSVGNYFLIMRLLTSKIAFYFYDTDNTAKTGTGTTALSNDTWYLFTTVINQNGNALLYLNNVATPEATIAIKGKKNIGTNLGNNLCNDYSTSPNNAFIGTTSKFRIFNKALSTEEINAIYNEGA